MYIIVPRILGGKVILISQITEFWGPDSLS